MAKNPMKLKFVIRENKKTKSRLNEVLDHNAFPESEGWKLYVFTTRTKEYMEGYGMYQDNPREPLNYNFEKPISIAIEVHDLTAGSDKDVPVDSKNYNRPYTLLGAHDMVGEEGYETFLSYHIDSHESKVYFLEDPVQAVEKAKAFIGPGFNVMVGIEAFRNNQHYEFIYESIDGDDFQMFLNKIQSRGF